MGGGRAAWAGRASRDNRRTGNGHAARRAPAHRHRQRGQFVLAAAAEHHPARRSAATGEIQVLGQTKIISDERTNSLLIYASKEDMKTIKDIIAKLDVVLAQVLIESAIISVTLTTAATWASAICSTRRTSATGPAWAPSTTTTSSSPITSAGSTGSPTPAAPFPGLQLPDVLWPGPGRGADGAASDSRARILQRPRIQTSHNEPASLFVGESRPYPTSSYYGGGAYGGYSSIQQLQIGVSLDVTPLINPGRPGGDGHPHRRSTASKAT